jgi:hypothetical protein
VNNTTGYNNTANGYVALFSNTSGYSNTASGFQALGTNTTGNNNTATGDSALYANTTGSSNTANGYFSLRNTTGNYNTANGFMALYTNTTGNNNTATGDGALQTNITGNYNTAIGYGADVASGALTNATAIGYGASVSVSNNMVFGSGSVIGWGFGVAPGAAAIRVGTGATNGNGATLTLGGVWTNASDQTKKHDIKDIPYGLSDVMKLHPVTYKLNGTDYQDIGFLAQEVKPVLPEIVYGQEGNMTLSYGQITAVLTKAVQELKTENDLLKKGNDLLKKRIEVLENKN